LERCVSALPKNSILLLEDIDCAFPSREEEDELPVVNVYNGGRRRNIVQVTMSGLLNVLDGVGSEDGKIVFATVSDTYFPTTFF
jgi:chaperone BCS1